MRKQKKTETKQKHFVLSLGELVAVWTKVL